MEGNFLFAPESRVSKPHRCPSAMTAAQDQGTGGVPADPVVSAQVLPGDTLPPACSALSTTHTVLLRVAMAVSVLIL